MYGSRKWIALETAPRLGPAVGPKVESARRMGMRIVHPPGVRRSIEAQTPGICHVPLKQA